MKLENIKVIYEDNHLLAVEKPVNVLSQGDNTEDPDMLTLLKEYIKVKYDKPGNVYMGLVHRLDRPVGGVMVFAKKSKAASRLSDQIRKREFKKVYITVVRGTPKNKKDTLEHYLLKDKRTNTVKVVSESTEGAKQAVLDYEVLASNEELSIVRVNLHTGRPHQIRVQFSSIGCPVYGDQKYGAHINKPGQQIALWSYEITCSHPTKKDEVVFKSLPPDTRPWDKFTNVLLG